MQALTYNKRVVIKSQLSQKKSYSLCLTKIIVSECILLIITSILIALFFSIPKVKASGIEPITQSSLLLTSHQRTTSFNSPLVKTNVDMTVTGTIARVKVIQEFHNPSNEWVNGHYVFPLPENAAVDHLMLKIGAREFEGQIHPKKKAKQIFERAKKQGKKASLIEQERPNIFTNSITNIGPKETVEVTLEYQQFVHYDQGKFSLRFPSTLTPRYIPIGSPSHLENKSSSYEETFFDKNINVVGPLLSDQVIDADRITPPTKNEKEEINTLNIRMDIDAGFTIAEVSSESHAITLSPISESRFDVFLKEHAKADRDFIVTWRRADESKPFVSHFTQMYQGEEYGLMMLVPPTMSENKSEPIPREAIFVLDTSGSMQGHSIEQAKSALIVGMEGLSAEDTFNIIAFNSHAKAYWRTPKKATPNNIISARQFIRELQANGGTEMDPALRLALKSHDRKDHSPYSRETRLEQVIFITDGSVGNEEHLMQIINRQLGEKRLFTIGIGSAPNTYFMSEAAKTGKGSFTYINDINHVGKKMQDLFAKINYPVLSDVALDFPPNIEVYPENIPDLYTGQPLLVSYKGSTWGDPIVASGNLTKASWTTTFPPAMLSAAFHHYQREPSGLNVLWARSKIGELTSQRRKVKDKEKFNQAIETTALDHHIVSEFTSLVAVDITPSRPLNQVMQDSAIPNHLPFGMIQQQAVGTLPQTATNGQLKLILGLLFIVISLCIHLITQRR